MLSKKKAQKNLFDQPKETNCIEMEEILREVLQYG